MPCGVLSAGFVGIIFGLPSLKLKGFYLIMSTVAAYFIIIWTILQFRSVTGGTDGLPVPRPEIGNFIFDTKQSYYYLVMVFTILVTFISVNLVRTRAGRAFIAIRDNELAAEVMGVNTWFYKLLAFFIGCVFAGLAGSLMVHYSGYVSTDFFPFMDSVWYLGMLIVGGQGSIIGVIFGVVAIKVLDQIVTIVGPILSAVVVPQAAASLGLILRGVVIIVFLIFEPKGLANRWDLFKSYYRRWPFTLEKRKKKMELSKEVT